MELMGATSGWPHRVATVVAAHGSVFMDWCQLGGWPSCVTADCRISSLSMASDDKPLHVGSLAVGGLLAVMFVLAEQSRSVGSTLQVGVWTAVHYCCLRETVGWRCLVEMSTAII
jgi:hypothetical protein